MKPSRKARIWMVAAGTGGHIFPGIAIAKKWHETHPETEFLFFATPGRLESEIVPKEGFPIFLLASGKWKGAGFFAKVLTLFKVFVGFYQALAESFNPRPWALITVGGYVSIPVAIAAWIRRIPIFIVEPNIRCGLANRLVSRMARGAFSTHGSDAFEKFSCPVVKTGTPLREGFRVKSQYDEVVSKLVVLGGSQGARSLCVSMLELAETLNFRERGVRMLLQCGAANFDLSQKIVADRGIADVVELQPFLGEMAAVLDDCDLVVARAGAMTVAELGAVGVPTVFVPFPYAADDHQRKNAELLCDAGAAKMVLDDENLISGLTQCLKELLDPAGGQKLRRQMGEAYQALSPPGASQQIVERIRAICSY